MSSVDFRELLSKPAEDIKAPVPLPQGTYRGLIKGHALDESREKKTPFIRLTITNLDPQADVDQDDLAGVDLSKKEVRKDFYLTEDSLYRFKEFIESCSIPVAGRTLGEMISELVNQEVMVELIHKMDKSDLTKPPYIEVKTITGYKAG